jgi:alkylated DNA repair dioxygenase AlkB
MRDALSFDGASSVIYHYRDGRDSIAPHSDGELYSKNKSVFTVAVGVTRKMKLVSYSGQPNIVFDFESGDLLMMCGESQSKWKHGIDQDPSVGGVRYSLTFRSTLLKRPDSKKRKPECILE